MRNDDQLLTPFSQPCEVEEITEHGVRLDNGKEILATSSGRLRRNRIRLLVGDRVTVEMSPYDLSKGRINYRHKDERAPATPVTRSGAPHRRR